MRRLPLVLLALLLSGCAQQASIPRESPLASQLDLIRPGATTRAELRARLGEPWLTSDRWGAELYADYTRYTDTVAIVMVPVLPYGRHHEVETLLVVFDEAGIVLGVEYAGATGRCGKQGCRRGELRGVEVRDLQVLLAPAGAPATAVAAGECLLEVDAPEQPITNRVAHLYLDDEFLQGAPQGAQARFRLPLAAGEHQLACVTIDRPRKGLLLRPWHRLADRPEQGRGSMGFRSDIEQAPVACAPGERTSYRLVPGKRSFIGPQFCAIEAVDTLPAAGSREVILPDRPSGRESGRMP